ncbi:helix-turn-helix domain-containing protein [Azotobacter chroococcum]|uniref:Helix-turn-helix domain-containing protein n=1 Tax=Azotobacter chroococcum TaxID=353 RepID=A0AA43Z6N4_9GAMM|nr:RodZ family helix-turn-helix domain-containing protein [Azotobacter chroococcum]NHN76667.1 helix-turn-helix domain-containing protein [Azotobacter chroococcum]
MMNASQTESTAAASVNPGEILRKGREANDWSLAQVAGQLNLPTRTLVQLEAGEFDRLPGHTFARGYVRSYAKLLGMDQARLVEAFDQYTGTNAKGSEVHSLGKIEQPLRISQSLLRLAGLALILLLVGSALFWWQERSTQQGGRNALNLAHVEVDSADGTTQIHPLDEPEDQAVAQALQPAGPQPQPTPLAGSAASTDSHPAREAASAATPLPLAPVAPGMPAPPAGPAPAPAMPVVVPAAPAAAPATAGTQEAAGSPASATEPAAGEGVLSIRFTADCWTQVTDARGKALFRGLKRAGDTLELRGQKPLDVRLGFAHGAEVSFNGQPVNLAPHTARGATARLKLGN